MKPLREALRPSDLETMSELEVLSILEPYVLYEVPEGVLNATPEELQEVDALIGRLANLHAFVAVLFGRARVLARVAKRESRTDDWHDYTAMADALYHIRSAVKLSWQACSRMITVNTEEDLFDRPNYQEREGKAAAPRLASARAHRENAEHRKTRPAPVRGWAAVRSHGSSDRR